MEPFEIIAGVRAIAALAENIWTKYNATKAAAERTACEAHEYVREFLRIDNPTLRSEQVAMALPRLRDALTATQRDLPDDSLFRQMVHLDLAAAYAVLAEGQLQQDHLNDACDCVVRRLESERAPSRRALLKKERNALYPLIKERRQLVTLSSNMGGMRRRL